MYEVLGESDMNIILINVLQCENYYNNIYCCQTWINIGIFTDLLGHLKNDKKYFLKI